MRGNAFGNPGNISSELKKLGADVIMKNRKKEVQKLVEKWEKTGLLDGLEDARGQHMKSNMAVMLQEQMKHLLLETSQTADIAGFQNVAFPIVRRVFAGLIANELVSVQPMSLPSGLLFYMDYRFGTVKAGNLADDFAAGGSLFSDQTGIGTENLATGGQYNLQGAYTRREKVSAATFAFTSATASLSDVDWDPVLSSSITNYKKLTLTNGWSILDGSGSDSSTDGIKRWVVVSGSSTSASSTVDGTPVRLGTDAASDVKVVRRHTKRDGNNLVFIVTGTLPGTAGAGASAAANPVKVSYVVDPTLRGGISGSLLLPEFEDQFANQSQEFPKIPEIDLRIQSVNVDSQTRKLKASWTPEIAQDLAAYQNLDVEVELTQVLSEQIALDIDREILAELLYNATAANYYWSQKPGNLVDVATGNTQTGASFTGTVREWYETLLETIHKVANKIYLKTLRGSGNFIVTSVDVCSILESTLLYKPVITHDAKETQFEIGTEKAGSLNNRYTVYKTPHFPRNKLLIGFKGSGFLETGFVYAPYVPLIVTPVVYDFESLNSHRGVMTRYAKHLVRSDFYGTVTVIDMNID